MSNEVGLIRKALSVFEDYNVSIEHIPSGVDSFFCCSLKLKQ